jgi:hypothetical protein
MKPFVTLAVLLAAACAVPGAAQGSAAAAKTCHTPAYPGSGYFLSLSVKGTTCATGKKVAVAYYHCRLEHGKRGHCTHKVLGYSCSEPDRESIPTEFDARVTCRRGAKKVSHAYQQNT